MGIATERVVTYGDIPKDLLSCSICHNLLWKPVSCESCEDAYCEKCVEQQQSRICSNSNCEFIRRNNVPAILHKMLSRVQIRCQYQINGCQEVLAYDNLQSHELDCCYECRCAKCGTTYTRQKGHEPAVCWEKYFEKILGQKEEVIKQQGTKIDSLEKENQNYKVQIAQQQQTIKEQEVKITELVNINQNVTPTTALLLSDGAATSEIFVERLTSSGISVTKSDITVYDGVPAASIFKVVICITGGKYSVDMPLNGQQSIVDAHRSNEVGVVFTEWAGYQVAGGRWKTLSQLLLATRVSGDIRATFTFTLVSNNHPIWTGLPKVFTTINMAASGLSSIINGGVAVATCPETTGTQQGVIVKPNSGTAGRIVQIALAAHYSGFNYANDNNVTTMMVNAVRWGAKLI